MRRRSLALLLLATPVVPALAQKLEYAPGTTRYRAVTTTKGTQTSPMGNAQFEVAVQQQLTVSIARQAEDTIVATLRVDSVAVKSTAGPLDASKLKGSTFVALLSPTGQYYSSTPPAGLDPQLAQISEAIGRFLPTYRTNLAVGSAWADTASGPVVQQGMNVQRTTVNRYKVVGDTTVGGEAAYAVERTTSVKAEGSGTMQGTPIALASTGSSEGRFVVSRKGVYLGGTMLDDVTVRITIIAQNAEISIRQNAQSTVEAIP